MGCSHLLATCTILMPGIWFATQTAGLLICRLISFWLWSATLSHMSMRPPGSIHCVLRSYPFGWLGISICCFLFRMPAVVWPNFALWIPDSRDPLWLMSCDTLVWFVGFCLEGPGVLFSKLSKVDLRVYKPTGGIYIRLSCRVIARCQALLWDFTSFRAIWCTADVARPI